MQKIFDDKFLVRFWSNVRCGDGPDDCWLWLGGKWRRGYGRIKPTGSRRFRSAHRISYEMHIGPLDGRMVLHSCDTPSCVNPRHLRLGSAKDNTDDMMTRDRWFRLPSGRGSANPRARISEQQAIEIFSRIDAGETNTSIAASFGLTHHAVSRMRRGLAWNHLRRVA